MNALQWLIVGVGSAFALFVAWTVGYVHGIRSTRKAVQS